MTISVILPTFQRPTWLSRCLEALGSQQRIPDEVLAVCRPEDTVTRELLQHPPGRLEGIVREIPVFTPGQISAMNAGLDHAKSEIIAFTDDDAQPHLDWLERIERHFLVDPGLLGVGGRDIVIQNGAVVNGTCRRVGHMSWFGRIVGNNHLELIPPRVIYVKVLKGANMAFRASALAGFRFDENFARGGSVGNELDLCLYVRRRGGRVIYDPEIRVNHYPAPRTSDVARGGLGDRYCYSHNTMYVLLKHLSWPNKIAMLIYYFLVGQRASWGLLTILADPALRGRVAWRGEVGPSIRGKIDGIRTYLRWRSAQIRRKMP